MNNLSDVGIVYPGWMCKPKKIEKVQVQGQSQTMDRRSRSLFIDEGTWEVTEIVSNNEQ